MVVVLAAPQGPDHVAVVYPRRQPKAEVRRDLSRLKQLTGWTLQDLVVTEDHVLGLSGKPTPMTGVDFAAPLAAPKTSGSFDLNPFLQTFKRYGRFGIQYLTPPTFRYTGAREHEDDHLKVHVTERPGSYLFEVVIKDADFGRFEMPPAPPPRSTAATAAGDTPSRGSVWLKLGGLLVLAVGVAFVVYAALDWYSRPSKGEARSRWT